MDLETKELISSMAAMIRRLLQENKMTRKELARRLGVTPSYVSQLCAGQNLTIATLARVVGEFDQALVFKSIPKASQ